MTNQTQNPNVKKLINWSFAIDLTFVVGNLSF